MSTDIPATAHVLQFAAPGQPEWRPMPVLEPQEGEVLMKVNAITTCPHWDLHINDGEPMFPNMQMNYPYTPGQPGHEAVGQVAALGPGVDGLEVGQRVVAWRDRGLAVRQGCYAQLRALCRRQPAAGARPRARRARRLAAAGHVRAGIV